MANDTAAASPLLRRFVAGLARQVPRDKLQPTLAPSSSSSSCSSNDALLRLFLEQATAALPMGSRARTAVGKDFDGALDLLREELERRVARELRDVGNGVADGSNDDVMAAGIQPQEGRQYPLLTFSREQYEKAWEAALQNNDEAALTLLRCSDHAAPADLVKDIEASSDATAALGSIRNALLLLRGNNTDASLDYRAVVAKFVTLLSSEEDDETSVLSSIRTLLSCLATLEALPDEAAGAVGTLAGRYAGVSNEDGGLAAPGASHSVAHVVSVALASFPTERNDRAPVAAANFVRGYLRGMTQISTSRDKAGGSSKRQRSAMSAGALASLAAALGAIDSLRGSLPVLPKTKSASTPAEERKAVHAQLNTWRSWADSILGAEGQNEEEEGADETAAAKEPEAGDLAEGKASAGRRGGKRSNLSALPEESELNDAELEGNITIEPPPRGRGRPKKRKGSDDASERSIGGAKQRKDSDAGESVASATPTRRSARVRAHSESSRGSLA